MNLKLEPNKQEESPVTCTKDAVSREVYGGVSRASAARCKTQGTDFTATNTR